ncbi:MAG: hypothetical protein KAG80_05265 [Nocardioides sp.]|nr:hypothetical protein [Nocardioides sp.]
MTTVWRTTHGLKYHSQPDCGGLIDGQAKARSEGKLTHAPQPFTLAGLPNDFRPCLRCWPDEPGWYEWLPLQLTVEQHSGASDGSQYEVIFFREVLMKSKIDVAWVTAQERVEREFAAPLRPDFAIRIPNHRPIAIEVDGATKSTKPRPDERGRSLVRDGELENLGWVVQHFSNEQVTNDPAWCRSRLQDVIRKAKLEATPAPDPVVPSHPPPPDVQTPATATAKAPLSAAQRPTSHRPSSRLVTAGIALGLAGALGVVFAVAKPGADGDLDGSGMVSPTDGQCPESHPIKGNDSDGELIYHRAGQAFYARTNPEACFATEADAQAAGYRAALR